MNLKLKRRPLGPIRKYQRTQNPIMKLTQHPTKEI